MITTPKERGILVQGSNRILETDPRSKIKLGASARDNALLLIDNDINKPTSFLKFIPNCPFYLKEHLLIG